MDKITRILVVVDPTVDRDSAVDRARLIAVACGAQVRVFINNSNTLDDQSYMYEGIKEEFFESQRQLFENHNQEILGEIVEEFQTQNLVVSSVFKQEHNLAESILTQAAEFKPDLLIKSSHHHGFVERSIVSNTDWRLIKKCPAPVLLVKPEPWHTPGSIVAAVDPMHTNAAETQLDHALIASASSLAEKLSLTSRVFHSYHPFISALLPLGDEVESFITKIGEQHKLKLQSLLEGHSISEENVTLSKGDLVKTLNAHIKEVDANILVIGALSRNILERAIIGNTTEELVEECQCDVLILKS